MNFSSVDVIWTLLGAALVYFMQAGFAMCEAGLTRAKNTGNILMKNMMDFCIGTPAFWLVGFGLMFGGSGAFIGKLDPRKLSVWISADLVFRHFSDSFLCNICHDRFRFHGRADKFQSLLFI